MSPVALGFLASLAAGLVTAVGAVPVLFIGGVVLGAIGVLLIFKPAWLAFS